jgi:hypothetical protein
MRGHCTCRLVPVHRLWRRPKPGPVMPFRVGLAYNSPTLYAPTGCLKPATGERMGVQTTILSCGSVWCPSRQRKKERAEGRGDPSPAADLPQTCAGRRQRRRTTAGPPQMPSPNAGVELGERKMGLPAWPRGRMQ